MKTFTFFISILYTICCTAQWSSNGPYGGPATAITTHSNNFYVGTNKGVFLSADLGVTWTRAGQSLQHDAISSLTSNGSTLFAGISWKGVYRSANNGVTWSSSNTGLTDTAYVNLFSSSQGIFAATPAGVFFSNTNGSVWTSATNGIPASYVAYSFAESGSAVFAGTYGMGLYQTTNNGITWTPVNAGVFGNLFIYSLLSKGNIMLAGTNNGVYRSTDGGITWASSNNGFPSGHWAHAFTSGGGATVFAGSYSEGIFISYDDGQNWSAANTGIPDLPFNTGLPHNYPAILGLSFMSSTLTAATLNGVYKSTDNASTWTESGNGIRGVEVNDIKVNSNTIIAGSNSTGIYMSTNSGASWSRSTNGVTSYNVLAVDHENTFYYAGAYTTKAFVSADNGATWTNSPNGLTSSPRVIDSDNGVVYAITTGGQFIASELFKSTDNGFSWSQINTNVFGYKSALAVSGTNVYMAMDSGRVLYSSNAGSTWTNIGSNLPNTTVMSVYAGSGSLYATSDSGVYKYGSASWVQLNNGLPSSPVVDVVEAGNELFVAVPGYGVYKSTDAGGSWFPFNSGLDNFMVTELDINQNTLFASTDNGVYSISLLPSYLTLQLQTEPMIYPTPSQDAVHLRLPNAAKVSLMIYDTEGRCVKTFQSEEVTYLKSYSLQGLSSGIYILQFEIADKTINHKLIKQ